MSCFFSDNSWWWRWRLQDSNTYQYNNNNNNKRHNITTALGISQCVSPFAILSVGANLCQHSQQQAHASPRFYMVEYIQYKYTHVCMSICWWIIYAGRLCVCVCGKQSGAQKPNNSQTKRDILKNTTTTKKTVSNFLFEKKLIFDLWSCLRSCSSTARQSQRLLKNNHNKQQRRLKAKSPETTITKHRRRIGQTRMNDFARRVFFFFLF